MTKIDIVQEIKELADRITKASWEIEVDKNPQDSIAFDWMDEQFEELLKKIENESMYCGHTEQKDHPRHLEIRELEDRAYFKFYHDSDQYGLCIRIFCDDDDEDSCGWISMEEGKLRHAEIDCEVIRVVAPVEESENLLHCTIPDWMKKKAWNTFDEDGNNVACIDTDLSPIVMLRRPKPKNKPGDKWRGYIEP